MKAANTTNKYMDEDQRCNDQILLFGRMIGVYIGLCGFDNKRFVG